MKKNLVLFFTIREFQNILLYKDVGLVPHYLGKECNLNVKILYSNEKIINVVKKFRNIILENIIPFKCIEFIKKYDKYKIFENLNFYKYLMKNAKKIDYLMLFHLNHDKLFLILLYKFLNKNGKIYLKADMDFQRAKKLVKYTSLKKPKYNLILRKVDLFSCEQKETFDLLKQKRVCGVSLKNKIVYIPNGFDEYYLKQNNICIKNFREKENIMITVGRIGTRQKNNEMLLEALDKIDLKNWKIYFIGEYTEEFEKKYNDFINKKNKTKIVLLGNIENKNILYDYYNRAKVFILTSRFEGFAIVYPEALRFGNYIITTNVGGAKDITNNGEIGSIIESENISQLKNKLLEVINDEIDLEKKYEESLNLSKEKFLWNKIMKKKEIKEFFK